MQENFFFGYVRVKAIRPPIPTNDTNRNGDPLYSIQATGISVCGSTLEKNTNSFKPEARELDLHFVGLSSRQAELLTEDCEVLIGGANMITFEAPIVYTRKAFGELYEGSTEEQNITQTDLVNYLTRAVLLANPDKDCPTVTKQIAKLIPEKRRKTILRVRTMNWTLKASPKQLSRAQSYDDTEDVSLAG